jgi:hypothetical protein
MFISISEDAIIEKREFNLRCDFILGGSLPLGDNSLTDCKYGGSVH